MHLSCPLPYRAGLSAPPPLRLPFTPRPWWKDPTVVTSGHISARKQEPDSSDRPRLHLSLCFILLQFLSIFLRVTRPSAFLLPLLSFLHLPPTISLSLACASSGHGSLGKLQRGCVRTGELSYFPSPLHDTQTQIHAFPIPMTKLQTCSYFLSFFEFFAQCVHLHTLQMITFVNSLYCIQNFLVCRRCSQWRTGRNCNFSFSFLNLN